MIRRALALCVLAAPLTSACTDLGTGEAESQTVMVAIVDTGIDPSASFARGVEQDDGAADDDGHGTEMAWVVHAAAPQADLISVKAAGPDGITDVRLAEGIDLARRAGANVILLAMAGAEPLPRTRAAIARADEDDVLVVAAAGNDGLDLDEHPAYPAAYAEPNVIAVAAADRSGDLLGTSNRGPTVIARGQGSGVPTCTLGGEATTTSGTSAAAALVAARAARILRHPVPLDELREALADDPAQAAWVRCP